MAADALLDYDDFEEGDGVHWWRRASNVSLTTLLGWAALMLSVAIIAGLAIIGYNAVHQGNFDTRLSNVVRSNQLQQQQIDELQKRLDQLTGAKH